MRLQIYCIAGIIWRELSLAVWPQTLWNLLFFKKLADLYLAGVRGKIWSHMALGGYSREFVSTRYLMIESVVGNITITRMFGISQRKRRITHKRGWH